MPVWALPPEGWEGLIREVGEWEYDGSEVVDFEEKEWGRVRNGEGMRRNKGYGQGKAGGEEERNGVD